MSKKLVCLISSVLLLCLAGNISAWTGVTIGNDPYPGSHSYDSGTGTWTVTGDGHDIWDNDDDFYYVFKYLKGDGSITARVVSTSPGSNDWVKGGVMMRESLDSTSTFADMVKSGPGSGGNYGGGGASFQWRPTTATGNASTSGWLNQTVASPPSLSGPYWVRVVRTGDVFRGYISRDGVNWTTVGNNQTIAMRYQTTYAGCYIGLCVTSHSTGEYRTVVFDNVSYTGDVYDQPPPKAWNPSPNNGAQNQAKINLAWSAGATAIGHDIYFGTDATAVANADTSSPEYRGQKYYGDETYSATSLEVANTIYYWRIDEFDGSMVYTKGDTWSFTTLGLKTINPSPADGAQWANSTHPDTQADLYWTGGFNTPVTNMVFFGTDATAVANADKFSPEYKGQKTTSYDPGFALTPGTTYYWRIDGNDIAGSKVYKGDVWSFRVSMTGRGLITREIWEFPPVYPTGNPINYAYLWPPFFTNNYDPPSFYDNTLTTFNSPDSSPDRIQYAARMHGWLYPPRTGSYTLYIRADDQADLYISTDENPDNAVRIANCPSNTTNWTNNPAQKAAPRWLLGGNRYYVATVWKQGTGGDHCGVGWQGPGITNVTIPTANYISPYIFLAAKPKPKNGSAGVSLTPTLKWEQGNWADSHDVYLGTNYNDVKNATTSSYPNVQYFSRGVNDVTVGPLSFNTPYYWRVDEVNNIGPGTDTLRKGQIWSFRTVGGAGGVKGMYYILPGTTAPPTNPWANFVGSRIDPNINFNWGNGTNGPGSPDPGMPIDYWAVRWIGNVEVPVSGNYTFYLISDDGCRLYIDGKPLHFQFLNQSSPEVPTAPMYLTAGTLHELEVQYYEATSWATMQLKWEGPITPKQVVPPMWLYPPVKASVPIPPDNTTGVAQTPTLGWTPGGLAGKHDVYLSDNWDDVNEATTLSPPSIYRGRRDPNSYTPPVPLDLGKIYYWRVDEVNGTNVWRGDIWRFTVRDYLIIEDFESYTNTSPNIIWQTWIAGAGGTVGYPDPNYAERNSSFIHGGIQAMPLDYDNTNPPFYSDGARTFAPTQDWTAYGVNLLSLWLRGNSGTPPGTFVENPSGIYTMTAAGADIWNVPDIRHPSTFHDEFHYAYTQVSGDCVIIAKVESVSNTNAWAKAGVMMRDSLDANSIHVMTCITPGSGAAFQYRLLTGGASTNVQDPNVDAPYWVAIQRVGSTFTGAYCADGASWTQLGAIDIVMADPIYIGLCLTSHNVAATCTAVFSNVTGLPSFTNQDIGIKSNTKAPLYVTLQDLSARTATITHDDPNVVITTSYQEWQIPLARFTSLNPSLDLTKVQKITLGTGGAGNRGTGTIYVDDIRLYVPRCISGRPVPAGDFTGGDCAVDYRDLQLLTNNWLVTDYQVTPIAPSPSDPCLMALYKFEGDLIDSSGNGRTLDPCGTVPGYTASKAGYGQALVLDGNDDCVCREGVGISGSMSRTIAGWVKANTLAVDPTYFINVFGFVGPPSGTRTNTFFDMEHRGSSQPYYCLHVYGWERNVAEFDTDWHHLAATYDSTKTIRWYNEGVLMGSDSSRTLNSSNKIQIGKRTDNAYRFPGLVDEVYIYARALSQGEIAYLAGKTMPFIQPLFPLLVPQAPTLANSPALNMYDDGKIDLRDYAVLSDSWLEEPLLWPPPLKTVWAYEFKNDANCYGGPATKRASDIYLEFDGPVFLVDTGAFGTFTGNGTNKIKLSNTVNTAGSVPPNGYTIIRVGSVSSEKTLTKWYWSDITHRRISNEMAGVGLSCKKIN